MLTSNVIARIGEQVDRHFVSQVEDTLRFAAIPSTRGLEGAAQDFMAVQLRARGYSVDDWNIAIDDIKDLPDFGPIEHDFSHARSVVGTLRPTETAGRSLILQGHCDVVPAGPVDMWTTPPFAPVVRDGWIYGRGTADMKAGTMAALYAVEAVRAAGYRLKGRLHFQSVIEEESTGAGALSVLQRGYRADCALLPEPTGQQFGGICVGVIWFRLKIRGVPAHVAVAGEGANAIKAAYSLIHGLEDLEREWNARAASDVHFGSIDHPINFNPGVIKGGDWPSSVPSWCDLDCRIAVLPGWDVDACRRDIEACVTATARAHPFLANNPPRIEWSGFLSHGYVMPDAPDIMRILEAAHRASTRKPFDSRISTGLNDARFYSLYYGIPAFCYGPVGERYHGFNERVNLDSIRETTKAIALFVADWCGIAK